MDVEAIFMSCFSIQNKPADIFDLIEAAISVGELKYPAEFEKRKSRIFKMISNNDDEEDDDTSTLDEEEEEEEDCVGDEDEVANVEEREKQSGIGKQQIIAPTNQKPTMKIKLSIKKNVVQVAPLKMESLTETKREEQKECTSGLTKSMPSPLMKMNVANKRVQVARPMQKETQSIGDMNMKFESSKRKFEESLAEQREAKGRIIMEDFHDMPKPATDSRAPRRYCWDRRRF